MKSITFKKDTTQRVYDDYIKRCRRAVSILSEADQTESLMEINSYIFEYIESNAAIAADEMTLLLNILERLGDPEITLKEVVAAKKINQAVKTFNLKHLIQALWLNLRNGIAYVILFIMTLVLISFPVLIVMKLLYPETTGLYIGKSTFFMGTLDDTSKTTEVLGNWFIPFTIVLSLLLYAIIIFILKLLKNKK